MSSVTTDSVPPGTGNQFAHVIPADVFYYLAAGFPGFPRPLIALTPRIWSRALPALNRRGPARLPMKLPPTVPSSSTWYILFKAGGSKARCWLCFDNSFSYFGYRRTRQGGHDQFFRVIFQYPAELLKRQGTIRADRQAEPVLCVFPLDGNGSAFGDCPPDQFQGLLFRLR